MSNPANWQAPYRSEAFAEDLDDEGDGSGGSAGRDENLLRRWGRALLVMLPAMMAVLSSAVATRLPPA